MSYLSQEPQIYQYSAHPNSGIQGSNNGLQFGDYPKQNAPIISAPYNRYIESQVNRVYQPVGHQSTTFQQISLGPTYQTAPSSSYFRPIIQMNNQTATIPTVNTSGNQRGSSGTNEARFTNYPSSKQSNAYQYNIFNSLDGPWNKCLTGNCCVSSPGNEGSTRQTSNKYQ